MTTSIQPITIRDAVSGDTHSVPRNAPALPLTEREARRLLAQEGGGLPEEPESGTVEVGSLAPGAWCALRDTAASPRERGWWVSQVTE